MIKYSIDKKYTTLVLIVIILVLGYVSYTNLSLDLLPDLELPMLVVVAQDPGQTPEAMEMKVTRPLERVLSSSEGLDEIQSISSDGSSMVLLSYVQGQNMDSAMIDVSGKIDLLGDLWQQTSRPMVLRLNPSMLPVMVMAIHDDSRSPQELTQLYEEVIETRLEGTSGVASLMTAGLFQEEIQVLVSDEKIHALNQELLDKISTEMDSAKEEIDKAKDKIEEGKAQFSSVSMPSAPSAFPDDLLDSSLALAGELAELSIKKVAAELQLASLEQVVFILESPIEDLDESQKLILDYLQDWPFDLTEDNLEEALLWTKEQLEESQEMVDLYEADQARLQARLDQVSTRLEAMSAAQGQMMAQAGDMLLQAQLASSELIKMEVLLESQLMLLESKKEEALAQANLSQLLNADTVSKLLTAQNLSLPLGYVKNDKARIPLALESSLEREELENLLLVDTGEEALGEIYLSDIAEINLWDNSKDYYAKVNGQPALLINIQKQSQANTSEVSKNLHETMDFLEENFSSLSLTPLMDQGEYIRWIISAVLQNILLGGLFAMAVLYVFLRDVRFTLLIALSIPVSIVASLVMMYFSGISLNLVSLAGLALGVGMMVDNSIVVIENTHRLSQLGYSPREAALEGAREMGPAITASTMTTVFVFLPILFTQGMARELFTDMALTIAFSLFASLLVALTLIPTVSSLRPYEEKESKYKGSFYEKSLRAALRFPITVLVLSVVLLVGSFAFLFSKGAIFMPPMDTPQMSMSLSPGHETQEKEAFYQETDKVFDLLEDLEDLELIGGLDGQTMMGQSTGISFYLLRDEESKTSSAQLSKEIEERLSDLDLEVNIMSQDMQMDALGGGGLNLRLLSSDLDAARNYANILVEALDGKPGLKSVYLEEELEEPELILIVDKDKAMKEGITPAEVYMQVEGKLAVSRSMMDVEGYPLKVEEDGREEISQKELLDLMVLGSQGGEVRLGDIASLEKSLSQPSIKRYMQKRYVEIAGDIAEDSNIQLVSQEVDKVLRQIPPPDQVEVVFSGEREQIETTMDDLRLMLVLAIIVIYGIMVIQFQSLLSPFIVMFTIPLAFTGGALALLMLGHPMSIMAMLGLIILTGVVVNNGIVFVDTVDKQQGELDDRLVETGRIRTRPIFMTALTTILGLVPLAMARGMGAEALQPMGIVIIGGLSYATLTTLYVIPVLYKLFHGGKFARSTNE